MNNCLKILLFLAFLIMSFEARTQNVVFDNEVIVYKKSFKDPQTGSKYWMLWTKLKYDEDPNYVRDILIVSDDCKYIANKNQMGSSLRLYTQIPRVKKLILHEPSGKEPFLEAVLTESATDYWTDSSNGHKMQTFFARDWGFKLPDEIADEIADLTFGKTKYHTNSVMKSSIENAAVPGVITKSKTVKSVKKDLTEYDQFFNSKKK